MDKIESSIIQLSLDLWREPGMLQAETREEGAFYYAPGMPESFQFFVPRQDLSEATPALRGDIGAFYAEKGVAPSVYAPQEMLGLFTANKNDILFTEVYMKADIDAAIRPAALPEGLTFKLNFDFNNSDYRSVYNDIFVNSTPNPALRDMYRVMADTLHRASQAEMSYQPSVVVGYSDGEPASMVTIIRKGDVAGIYNVGTRPSHRHKGLADQTMQEAFRQARDMGVKTLYLLTTSESSLEETYKRRGFKPFARYSHAKVSL